MARGSGSAHPGVTHPSPPKTPPRGCNRRLARPVQGVVTAQEKTLTGGQLLAGLANAMGMLFREFLGKGPEHCKAYWTGEDMLVVLLVGGYTVAEQTLFEAGRGAAVQASRDALHKTMSARMRDTVESLTGRRVVAFLPASHQDPDLTAELFVLEPDGGPATPP